MIDITVIIIPTAFVILSAVVDSEHLKDNDYIENHTSRWFLRLTFFIAMGLVEWRYAIASSLIFAATFDQVLNYLTGNPFWHLGSTAKWDVFFYGKKWLYIPIKVLVLVIGIYLFI